MLATPGESTTYHRHTCKEHKLLTCAFYSKLIQESPANATVRARQCRHLAIKFEVGHRSCDKRSDLCSHLAKALKLRKQLVSSNPPLFDAAARGDPVGISG